ncbi:hypothetical protein DMH17_13115 [Raoultella planticola]|nr:hypothetical protein [Raoultella planticola]
MLRLLKQGENLRLHRDIQRGSRQPASGSSDPRWLAARLASGPRQQLRSQRDPGGNRLDAGTAGERTQRFEIFQRLFDNLKQGLTRVERGELVLIDELGTPQTDAALAT